MVWYPVDHAGENDVMTHWIHDGVCTVHGRRKRGGGDGGTRPPGDKSAGDVPQKLGYFSKFFFLPRIKIL